MKLTEQFYILSDLHFGHKNIIEYEGRPANYTDLIIKGWQKTVGKRDKILFLGDLALCNKEDAYKWCSQLTGEKFMIRGNHDGACFSEKTKLLTLDGYKKYNELKIGEIVPTVNLKTNSVEYNPIRDIFIYDNFTPLCVVNHRGLELEITWNHVLLYQSAQEKTKNTWKKDIAENRWGYKSSFRVPITFGRTKPLNIESNYLKLLGWILTDGSISKRGELFIYQSKSQRIGQIKILLNKLKIPYTFTTRNRVVKEICGKKIIKALPQGKFFINSTNASIFLKTVGLQKKKELPLILWYLSNKQFHIFLDAIVDGDGHVNKHGHKSIWGKKDFLEKLLGLCVTHNIRAKLIKQKTRNNYYLSVYSGKKGKCANISPRDVTREKYGGKVWCVNVKNNTIFTELNGKPIVTGNSETWYRDMGFTVVPPIFKRFKDKYENYISVLFTHEPVIDLPENWFNVHGHIHLGIHRDAPKTARHFNACVEVLDYTPIKLHKILDGWRKYKGIKHD